jgi:hypothetical protein
MAPQARGRALHHGTKAQPQYDRPGRRTKTKIVPEATERQAPPRQTQQIGGSAMRLTERLVATAGDG